MNLRDFLCFANVLDLLCSNWFAGLLNSLGSLFASLGSLLLLVLVQTELDLACSDGLFSRKFLNVFKKNSVKKLHLASLKIFKKKSSKKLYFLHDV